MTQCRSCKLTEGRTPFRSIFDHHLSDIYEHLIQKQLSISSPYNLICQRCVKFLQQLENFRMKCIESNDFFEKLERQIADEEKPIEEKEIKIEMLPEIILIENDVIKEEPTDEYMENVTSVPIEKAQNEENRAKKNDEPITKEVPVKKKEKSLKIHVKKVKGTVNKNVSTKNKREGDEEIPEETDDFSVNPIIPPETYSCTTCLQTFKSKGTLRYHMERNHKAEKYECHFCSKKFIRKSFLLSHIYARHLSKDFIRTGEFTCPTCKKEYLNNFLLQRHIKVHSKMKIPCPLCAKMVQCMKTHMKIYHEKSERFFCDKCPKHYKLKHGLDAHKVVHENKKFPCKVCGKEFNLLSKVREHMRYHQEDPKMHPCNHCDRVFRFRGHLLQHLRYYSGERPYVCDICSFAFKTSSTLKMHMHYHNGTRPYMCKICPYKTKRKIDYLKHLEQVHQITDETEQQINN